MEQTSRSPEHQDLPASIAYSRAKSSHQYQQPSYNAPARPQAFESATHHPFSDSSLTSSSPVSIPQYAPAMSHYTSSAAHAGAPPNYFPPHTYGAYSSQPQAQTHDYPLFSTPYLPSQTHLPSSFSGFRGAQTLSSIPSYSHAAAAEYRQTMPVNSIGTTFSSSIRPFQTSTSQGNAAPQAYGPAIPTPRSPYAPSSAQHNLATNSDPQLCQQYVIQAEQVMEAILDTIEQSRLPQAIRELQRLSLWFLNRQTLEEMFLTQDELPSPDWPYPSWIHRRKSLWRSFNACWLALAQKQLELSELELAGQQAYMATHQQSRLSLSDLQTLGDDLIRLCDALGDTGREAEPNLGLVDYEYGVQETRILEDLDLCRRIVLQLDHHLARVLPLGQPPVFMDSHHQTGQHKPTR